MCSPGVNSRCTSAPHQHKRLIRGVKPACLPSLCNGAPKFRKAWVVQVRAQMRKIFTNMGFEEMPTNNYVESR